MKQNKERVVVAGAIKPLVGMMVKAGAGMMVVKAGAGMMAEKAMMVLSTLVAIEETIFN